MKQYIINCKNCGVVHNSSRASFHIYCSVKCQKEFEYNKNILGWLEGSVNPLNTNGVLKPFVRRYFFRKYNYRCCVCGWGEMNDHTKTIPLEVDHIDGNYKNNELSNLRLLCPNCHSLTPTYKSSNKGKGRLGRKVM